MTGHPTAGNRAGAGPPGPVTVIGVDAVPAVLRPPAAAALAAATLVVGGRRQLGAVDLPDGARTVMLGDVAAGIDAVVDHLVAGRGPVAVLASGDPGYFGIVAALRRRGLVPRVHPGVSSVALAFARLGLAWDDAAVVSAHGRDLAPAVNVCRARPKVAVLTGPGAGPARIGALLAGTDRVLAVATALGTAGETVERVSPSQAAARTWDEPNVVLSLSPGVADPGIGDPGVAGPGIGDPAGRGSPAEAPGWIAGQPPGSRHGGWAMHEDAFEHRDRMVTKAEVRALVLARLGPRAGQLIWDVGAGSGSIAVECARLGAAAVAVDRDPDAVELVTRNARAHQVNVFAVQGEAPAALADLPDPDGVFVGGGGLTAVAGCVERTPEVVVVALAALDRVRPVWDLLTAAGYDAGGAQLAASRIAPLPDGGLRLAATNPVVVVWGYRAWLPAGREAR